MGAQLPLLIRGLYYDQWRPAAAMRKERRQEEFIAHVAEGLRSTRPVNVKDAVQAVFGVLDHRIATGEAEKVASVLPHGIRELWRSSMESAASRPISTDKPVREVEERAMHEG